MRTVNEVEPCDLERETGRDGLPPKKAVWAIAILGAGSLLLFTALFSPGLVRLLEVLADQKAPLEVFLRAHFLVAFAQILLVLFYLLFVKPLKDPKKRLLLYFLAGEALLLCAIWIFDRTDHLFRGEDSALTFFSAALLQTCSMAAFLNLFFLRYHRIRGALVRLFWGMLGVAFFYASLDEIFTIHERIGSYFKGHTWVSDLTTALYAVGALGFLAVSWLVLKRQVFRKGSMFFRTLLAAGLIYLGAVAIDSFDFLLTFLDPFIFSGPLFNSIEEILEFTAATLFLYAFVLNILEMQADYLVKKVVSRIGRYRFRPALRKLFWAVIVADLAFFGLLKGVFSEEQGPVLLEKGYRAILFADSADGLANPDGLVYDENLGLIVGNGELAANVLAFDRFGRSRVFCSAETGIISAEGLAVQENALLVADDSARKVSRYPKANIAPKLVAGEGLKSPEGLAVDDHGNLYVADEKLSMVIRIGKERWEVMASAVDGLETPEEIAVDDAGTLYVTDERAQAVFKITPSGKTSRFLGGPESSLHPEGIVFHRGNLYLTDNEAGTVSRYDLQGRGGKLLTFARRYSNLSGLAFDERNRLYVVSSDRYSTKGYIFQIDLDERTAHAGVIGFRGEAGARLQTELP